MAVKLLDPRHLHAFFQHSNFYKHYLEKCNSQEYLAGAKVGQGYFLTTYSEIEEVIETQTVEITLFPNEVPLSLHVRDILRIDQHHCILITCEKKYRLLGRVVEKNYNMPDDDSDHKTFTQIIDEILLSSSFVADHTGANYPSRKPEKLKIDGMTILEALDYMLRAIGHTFHDRGDGTLYITTPGTDRTDRFRSYEESLIEHDNPTSVSVLFRYRDITDEQYYYQVDDHDSKSGNCESGYYPFFYVTDDNQTTADSLGQEIIDLYRTTSKRSFHVAPKYEDNWYERYYTRCLFIDTGTGPNLIYEVEPLPRLPIINLWNNGSGEMIQYIIDSVRTATSQGDDAPYTGLKIATVTIKVTSCGIESLIGTQVDVVDHSQCIFDLEPEQLEGIWGWGSKGIAESRDPEAEEDELTPCHWVADDRCCTAYDDPDS